MIKIGRPVDGTLPAFKSVCASSASRSAFLRALRGYEVVSSVFMVGYGGGVTIRDARFRPIADDQDDA